MRKTRRWAACPKRGASSEPADGRQGLTKALVPGVPMLMMCKHTAMKDTEILSTLQLPPSRAEMQPVASLSRGRGAARDAVRAGRGGRGRDVWQRRRDGVVAAGVCIRLRADLPGRVAPKQIDWPLVKYEGQFFGIANLRFLSKDRKFRSSDRMS